MGRKEYTGETKEEHAFVQIFGQLSSRYDSLTVWRDFVHMFACALSNSVDYEEVRRSSREESYLTTMKGYPAKEQESFVSLTAITINALMTNPEQDFLGTICMNLNLQNKARGQYFTSWELARVIAFDTLEKGTLHKIKKQGFVSVLDCCCGAGCMLMAFADACRTRGINYRRDVLFVGQDVEPIAAKMCYIQLSLLQCAGYVIVGNGFMNVIDGDMLHPVIAPEFEIWYTPKWFSRPWKYRRSKIQPRENTAQSKQKVRPFLPGIPKSANEFDV